MSPLFCLFSILFFFLFSLSVVSDSLQPTDCSTPGLPILHHLEEFAQTHVHCVDDAIQLSHSLFPLLIQPSIFPIIKVFYSDSACVSFIISASNDYPGLISFRMDWFDLLAVQGTLMSLLQHHSSKASILWGSAFFMIQLSHHLFLHES